MATTQDRFRIGRVVAGSLFLGLATATFLVFAPFVPAEKDAVTASANQESSLRSTRTAPEAMNAAGAHAHR